MGIDTHRSSTPAFGVLLAPPFQMLPEHFQIVAYLQRTRVVLATHVGRMEWADPSCQRSILAAVARVYVCLIDKLKPGKERIIWCLERVSQVRVLSACSRGTFRC